MPTKERSYVLTIRPRNGLHNEYAIAVENYVRKFPYGAYVYEMEHEARHIHAQIFLEKHTDINDIRKALFRIAEKTDPDWSEGSKRVLSQGVVHAYNDDWTHKYCTKDGDLPYCNFPEDTQPYYPDKATQEKAMASRQRVADAYFNRLKDLWHERPDGATRHPFSHVDVALFYYDQMFKDKTIAVVRNDRDRKSNARCLFHYIFPHANALEMVLSQTDIDNYEGYQIFSHN